MTKEKIIKLYDNFKYDEFLKEADEYLNSFESTDIMQLCAEIYFKKQEFGKAFNFYNKIIKIQPDNDKAKTGAEMCRNILNIRNIDRYADPNTHMDPWFD